MRYNKTVRRLENGEATEWDIFHWKRLVIAISLAMFVLIQPKTRAEDWSNRLDMRVYDGFMR
ncbi:MAG: hypothetical protein ACLTDS_12960 [Bianqueaceae bacterium]